MDDYGGEAAKEQQTVQTVHVIPCIIHPTSHLFMPVSVLFNADSQLHTPVVSKTAFPFFPITAFLLSSSLVLVHPPKLCVKKKEAEKKDGTEKIESEIVGVIDKIGWQRWVDKREMDK